jgi:CRP/FNR family transcriptional regulator
MGAEIGKAESMTTNRCSCRNDDCVLCGARFFSALSVEDVCEVRGLIAKRHYGAREILFRQGDPGTHLYLLNQGLLKLTVTDRSGREQIIGLATPGLMLGFDSLADEKHAYSAETVAPASVCILGHKDMLRVLEQNPQVAMHTVAILNRELADAQRLIRLLGQKSAAEKIASLLLILAEAAYGPGAKPSLPLMRQEIAEILGLAVETVSRVFTNFREADLIQATHNSVCILDMTRLRAVADASLPPQVSPAASR